MFKLAAHAVQILAVFSHGLNQILNKSVLHNINTSKIESEKFVICGLGAVNRRAKRGGIIASPFGFCKA